MYAWDEVVYPSLRFSGMDTMWTWVSRVGELEYRYDRPGVYFGLLRRVVDWILVDNTSMVLASI
jgi:hypothetical protein